MTLNRSFGSVAFAARVGLPVYDDDANAPPDALFFNASGSEIKYKDENETVHTGGGGSGAESLSKLSIDADKDWNGYSITNLNDIAATTASVSTAPEQDTDVVRQIDLEDHAASASNPHNVTASQADALPISGGTVSGDLEVGERLTASSSGIAAAFGSGDSEANYIRLRDSKHGAHLGYHNSNNAVYGGLVLQGGVSGSGKGVEIQLDDGGGDFAQGTTALSVGGDTADVSVPNGDLEIGGNIIGGDTGRSTIQGVDHGADPSGGSSSSSALQSAVDAADEGDKVVWGEPGTYYLDDEITAQKRIELDLHEGIIESDHHDEQAWPDDQDHYMPLFRVRGSLGTDDSLTAPLDRGEDQLEVENPGDWSVGDGVVVRNETPNRTAIPSFTYRPTQTYIREIEDDVLYLEDGALINYTTDATACHAEFIDRPILKNIHIYPRNEPTFDSDAGKVLGGFRHGIATEVCDHPQLENCSVQGYDSHLWSSRDDIAPSAVDCEAKEPMNLSGSCGEPIYIMGSRDVSISRPTIKECRRGVDSRCGAAEVTVEDPDITGVSLIGISWHDTTDVAQTYTVRGGRVEAKPDDPTMDNKDGSQDRRQELQAGRPFVSSEAGEFHAVGTDFVGRQNAILKGPTDIRGGELYKYGTSGTVLTVNSAAVDVTAEGFEIGSYGSVAQLLEIAGGENISFPNLTLNASGNPTDGVQVLGGEDVSISVRVSDGAPADRVMVVEDGSNLNFDLDAECNGNYGYLVNGGTDIDIEGRLTGTCSNEQIQLDGGDDIDIDARLYATAGNARGVRLFTPTNVDITGAYQGTGIGIMFSGGAENVTVRDMRIEVTDGSRAAAVGTDGGASGLTAVKWIGNDMRGEKDDILMNDDVNGFWAVDNIVSNVGYTDSSTVGRVEGNIMV